VSKLLFLGGRVQLFDNDGDPLAGGKVEFYEPGTSTEKDTYTTSALAVANANPVVLDSAGRASVHLNGNYKVVVKDADDVTIYTEDAINPDDTGASSVANLAPNGSFESNSNGDGKTPDDWTLTEESGSTVALDTSDQQHGLRSIAFTSTGSGGGNVESTSFIAVTPLRAYQLSFLIKSSVVDTLNIVKVHWYTAAGALVSSTTVYTDDAANPTSWERNSAVVTPPSTARLAKIQLIGCDPSDATTGTTRFDDVIFAEGALVTTITTRGDLVIGDATGEADRLAIGTAGQVLSSDGNDPVWVDQGREVLATGAVDDEAFLTVLGLTDDYQAYELVFDSLKPATDAQHFRLQFTRDGGDNWVAGTSYWWVGWGAGSTNSLSKAASGSDSGVQLSWTGAGTGTNERHTGRIIISEQAMVGRGAQVRCEMHGTSASPEMTTATMAGNLGDSNDEVDGFRLFFASGNIDTMNYTLYGLRKAA